LRQPDFHGQELRMIDAELGRVALEREEVKRLMTIPGVDATVALSIVAAVGDFYRFARPERLVSYLGPEPAGAPIRQPARVARADHQAGAGACPRDARRGGVGGRQDAGAAAGVL